MKAIINISNFPGYLIGTLLVLQYFGANSPLLDTGGNHTLILQCLTCIASLPFLFTIDKNKSLYIVGIVFLFLLFVLIHYEVISRFNDYNFALSQIWSYVKFCLYLFVFLAVYFYFKGSDFIVITKFAKYIVLALFVEALIYLIFKLLGFSSIVGLFESVEGRFAGIFLHHNAILSFFAFFVISYVIYFGSLAEKIRYLTIGAILVILSGERSAFFGLMFLAFSYVFFSYNEDSVIYKYKVKIVLTFSFILLCLIVPYTIYFRVGEFTTVGEFFRTILIRIYFSYLTVVHLFESSNPIFGFGPFVTHLPVNIADMHADYVEKYINFVKYLFGITEETYFRSFHDTANLNAPTYSINAHNTFIILLYQFGYFFLIIFLYFVYLFFGAVKYIRKNLKEISLISKSQDKLNINENFFQISSLVFIIASLPLLILLSLDGFLILTAIAFGHIGSIVRKVADG